MSSILGTWPPIELSNTIDGDNIFLFENLNSKIKLFIGNDGSMTRNLFLLTSCKTTVRVVSVEEIAEPTSETIPDQAKKLSFPIMKRTVFLYNDINQHSPSCYAISFWSKEDYLKYLPNPNIPIGTSANMMNLEIYKEIDQFYVGKNEVLSREYFHETEKYEFLGRIVTWTREKLPLCVISEIFHVNFLNLHLL